jgi:hypothetical protein
MITMLMMIKERTNECRTLNAAAAELAGNRSVASDGVGDEAAQVGGGGEGGCESEIRARIDRTKKDTNDNLIAKEERSSNTPKYVCLYVCTYVCLRS